VLRDMPGQPRHEVTAVPARDRPRRRPASLCNAVTPLDPDLGGIGTAAVETTVGDDAYPEEQPDGAAPSVVALVVAHDPGPFFEDVLAGLAAQDYPNLAVLVIDNGSAEDPTERIAAVLPGAFVRRLEQPMGFGAAANVGARMVEGAPFLLVCHDDVALAPNAVRVLVEEAFRSNAGVVAPKLVSWHRPELLVAVGMGADRFGAPSPLCERGELDQEQHDAVRDVFYAPDACMLVRADLFGALGGFDEAITFHGGDTDLSWRVHLAGARVVVAPGARARHVEAMGERRPDDRRRMQQRHRLRMILTDYRWFHTVGIVFQQAVLSVVEIVLALGRGRVRHAGDVVAAWTWNLRRVGSVRAKRRTIRQVRKVTDLEVRRLQVRGSARVTAYLRGQLRAADIEGDSIADAGLEWASEVRRTVSWPSVAAVGLVAVLFLLGSRGLISGSIPVIGEFAPLPAGPTELLRTWWSGWREVGAGFAGGAPIGFLLFGLSSVVGFGSTGLVRTVAVLGLLPVGWWGVWRVATLGTHRRGRVAALVAYAVNPLPYAAVATGSWRGLTAYAAAPWILHRLTRLGGIAPAARGPFRGEVAALGLTVGAATVLLPATPLLVAVVFVALLLAGVLGGSIAGLGRTFVGAVLGVAVGAGLHASSLATSLTLAPFTDPDLLPAGRAGGAQTVALGDLLRFDATGSGGSRVVVGLLVAALLGPAIGRAWRWGWALRGWLLVAVPLAAVAVVQGAGLDVDLPPATVLLAPAALGVAVAVATGVAGFDLDLPGYRFGWRQGASVLAAAGLALASLPMAGRVLDGRWGLPTTGFEGTLTFLDREAGDDRSRVLWLGVPEVLPVAGWPVEAGLSYATTIGFPSTGALWSGPESDGTAGIAEALRSARAGDTTRLGRALGLYGIRYVVVVERAAPAPFADEVVAPAPWLAVALGDQLDLQQVEANAAVQLYRNVAWRPIVSTVPVASDDPSDLPPVVDLSGAPLGTTGLAAAGATSYRGTVEPGIVNLAEGADVGWVLDVAGRDVPATRSFGWGTRFRVEQGGTATLEYRTPVLYRVRQTAQAAGWVLVAVIAWRATRPRRDDEPVAVPVADLDDAEMPS